MSSLGTRAALAACRNVTVVVGRGESAVTALSDVSVSIGRGERISLTGRSGSGKTTLLHVLGGLIAPTSSSRGESRPGCAWAATCAANATFSIAVKTGSRLDP